MKLINFVGLFALLVLMTFALAAAMYLVTRGAVAQDLDSAKPTEESPREFGETAEIPGLDVDRGGFAVPPPANVPAPLPGAGFQDSASAFPSTPSDDARRRESARDTPRDPNSRWAPQGGVQYPVPATGGPGINYDSQPIGHGGPLTSDNHRHLEKVPVQVESIVDGKRVVQTVYEYRRIQDPRANSKTQAAIQKLSKAKSAKDKKKSEEELRAALDAEYEAFLKQHEARLGKVEAQLKSLQMELDRRRKAKPELLELRIKTIINNVNGLGWPGDQVQKSSQFNQPQVAYPPQQFGTNPNNSSRININKQFESNFGGTAETFEERGPDETIPNRNTTLHQDEIGPNDRRNRGLDPIEIGDPVPVIEKPIGTVDTPSDLPGALPALEDDLFFEDSEDPASSLEKPLPTPSLPTPS